MYLYKDGITMEVFTQIDIARLIKAGYKPVEPEEVKPKATKPPKKADE